MLTIEQKAELKKELLRQKEQLTKHIDHNEEIGDNGELSLYDNHPADIGTELYERERDLALDEHCREQLEKIDAALQAMKNGTYGICKKSGEEIPFERLQAVPTALYNVEHSPNQKPQDGSRVVDERLTHPDDGIDSFRDAAVYGTSETPSDFVKDHNYNELYSDEDDN
ncbi:TraR/DksA C4-type zinc finger protein [Domibacillus epiphyticus]|nr:TraR/DksA C4-type zinc finger protein [Domibacillus epiphyticus]